MSKPANTDALWKRNLLITKDIFNGAQIIDLEGKYELSKGSLFICFEKTCVWLNEREWQSMISHPMMDLWNIVSFYLTLRIYKDTFEQLIDAELEPLKDVELPEISKKQSELAKERWSKSKRGQFFKQLKEKRNE